MWSQKAKTNWDINGDRNTKFFQAVVKTRRRRNRIVQIKKDDTTWITNPNDIQQCFVDHYTQLFLEPQSHSTEHIHTQIRSLPIPTLSDNQDTLLDQPIIDAEIFQAVTQLSPLKTPGPDGIPAAFYQNYWSIVKQDVLQMVHAFFHSGFLLKSLNYSFITLIPKTPTPETVSQFKPISLCNVTYKIISKVLINRLKPIMDSLVTPYQNAFIQGRQITDNIILA